MNYKVWQYKENNSDFILDDFPFLFCFKTWQCFGKPSQWFTWILSGLSHVPKKINGLATHRSCQLQGPLSWYWGRNSWVFPVGQAMVLQWPVGHIQPLPSRETWKWIILAQCRVMYRLPQSLEEENPVQPGVGNVVPRKAFPRWCFLFFSFSFIEIQLTYSTV